MTAVIKKNYALNEVLFVLDGQVGWKAGCRPLICVDGTFLKGKARGLLLTAVGTDANDSIFPIAFALVEKENKHHWNWFMQCLQRSFQLENGEKITVMSDMQKVVC